MQSNNYCKYYYKLDYVYLIITVIHTYYGSGVVVVQGRYFLVIG